MPPSWVSGAAQRTTPTSRRRSSPCAAMPTPARTCSRRCTTGHRRGGCSAASPGPVTSLWPPSPATRAGSCSTVAAGRGRLVDGAPLHGRARRGGHLGGVRGASRTPARGRRRGRAARCAGRAVRGSRRGPSRRPPRPVVENKPFDLHQPLAWSPDVLQRRSLDAVLVLRPPGEPLRLPGIAALLWAMFEKPSSPADVAAAAVDAFRRASDGA